MSKKKKGLAGFGAVANVSKEETKEVQPPVKEEVNVPEEPKEVPTSEVKEEKETGSDIASLVSGITTVPEAPKKKQVSVYLDEDVIKEFNKFGKKHGKGKKSELVNEFLRKVFNI